MWGLLPAAVLTPRICPSLSLHLCVSGIHLLCQTLSPNNWTVLLTGLAAVTNTDTYTQAVSHHSRDVVILYKYMHYQFLLTNTHIQLHECYSKAPLQQSKHMQQSLHAQTQRRVTYNQPLRNSSMQKKERIHWGSCRKGRKEITTLTNVYQREVETVLNNIISKYNILQAWWSVSRCNRLKPFDLCKCVLSPILV